MGFIASYTIRRIIGFVTICIFHTVFIPAAALSQAKISEESENSRLQINRTTIFQGPTDELVSQIREATKLYKSTKEAEKAGYRPFGPDMPNMGQHWINTRIALVSNLELNKPSTLTYLSINGEAILTGVAYTTSVQPGEAPPDLPLQEMKWHFHAGSLEDEAHGIHRAFRSQDQKYLAKLAMVHAWVWSENPAGIFSPDNWSLSFIRHGLKPPSDIAEPASKALFLASGHVDYYMKFIELCVQQDTFDKGSIRNILKVYSRKIESLASYIPENRMVLQREQQRIEVAWNNMWDMIRAELGPDLWHKVDTHL